MKSDYKQIKSKKRVKDFGEVYTREREVKAMLDLVQEETYRTNSLFLEPACGNGNFLEEILKRKLSVSKTKDDVLTSLRSIYAIDILEDNIIESKKRLYELVKNDLTQEEAFFIMDQNIVCGDSLGLLNHTPYIEMVFDVIIGNPPYQLNDGGHGASAMPLYHKFVQQAKKLNPKYITMIIPSRWFSGGRGLDTFRTEMLNDLRIKELHDFKNSSQCFPSVDIEGGVCYFLWDSNYEGMCNISSYLEDSTPVKTKRFLLEEGVDTFLRDHQSVEVFKKVRAFKESTFDSIVSAQTPFGLLTNFKNYSTEKTSDSIKLYGNKLEAFVSKSEIKRNFDWIDRHKIYISKAYGVSKKAPYRVLNKPFLGKPGSCCTQTYLVVGPFDSEKTSLNVKSYMETKFFSYMVLMKKISQDNSPKVFSLVPIQDFSKPWTDQELYEKYGLTQEEIDYIESMIRPMN